jgi:hypothetical protein
MTQIYDASHPPIAMRHNCAMAAVRPYKRLCQKWRAPVPPDTGVRRGDHHHARPSASGSSQGTLARGFQTRTLECVSPGRTSAVERSTDPKLFVRCERVRTL